MDNSMLAKQLREIKELRAKLDESPTKLEYPVNSKGLKIVAYPCKIEARKRQEEKAKSRRAYFAKKNVQPLTQKLQLQNLKAA